MIVILGVLIGLTALCCVSCVGVGLKQVVSRLLSRATSAKAKAESDSASVNSASSRKGLTSSSPFSSKSPSETSRTGSPDSSSASSFNGFNGFNGFNQVLVSEKMRAKLKQLEDQRKEEDLP
ncbi:hypothetical protein BCR33DRAFT_715986 [Rhizoclosmatium globosum]|uniref:Uncharacterized protein n=1 Tax=Rhizoclosmatium globosum TaxID=329046 RepID=A0A1Y2CGM4_9FUNG|nr:hypothetical protein BCR33DRAFT_715986 [Rhizoclosmatium globosum]|eukprot:ORY45974.1 hypothetical protein BCR33DRAFT_715986 [Rhizoclosmatium globosum]